LNRSRFRAAAAARKGGRSRQKKTRLRATKPGLRGRHPPQFNVPEAPVEKAGLARLICRPTWGRTRSLNRAPISVRKSDFKGKRRFLGRRSSVMPQWNPGAVALRCMVQVRTTSSLYYNQEMFQTEGPIEARERKTIDEMVGRLGGAEKKLLTDRRMGGTFGFVGGAGLRNANIPVEQLSFELWRRNFPRQPRATSDRRAAAIEADHSFYQRCDQGAPPASRLSTGWKSMAGFTQGPRPRWGIENGRRAGRRLGKTRGRRRPHP